MKKQYKIEMQGKNPFDWHGFLECSEYCRAILLSIHLHNGTAIDIHERLEFEGLHLLTRACKDKLNAKIKATYPLILKDLTSHLNKGYMIIEAEINQYGMARWQSKQFAVSAL
ncbi:hypothetical protein [Bacillus testis]|uniref:hypothetical protein n=1 Tax=Bacillus testis TaxID=1622072 RepID=UPI00067F67A6|nr:hypothetical protein [Bacillus testis]